MLKEHHKNQQIDHIRELYLRELAGERLKDYEECELQTAQLSPEIKKMCRELKEVYNCSEMMELLKERPTSKRLQEIIDSIYNHSSPKLKFPHFFSLRKQKRNQKQRPTAMGLLFLRLTKSVANMSKLGN